MRRVEPLRAAGPARLAYSRQHERPGIERMTCGYADYPDESLVLPRSEDVEPEPSLLALAPGSTELASPPVSTSTDQSDESARIATNSGSGRGW